MAWPVSLAAGKILVSEGEESHSMYLLQEGRLVVTIHDGEKDIILGFIDEGEIVGELSFLDQKKRSATVRAMTDCNLAQIPTKLMEEVFKNQPEWFEVFIKTLVARLRHADARIKI